MSRGGDAEVLVVGAGAAGLWAAARAGELGRRVLLLEKTPRTGTKVLASGGTRCNLTTTLGPEGAGALFGQKGERFLRRGLRALPPAAVRERFHALGVPTITAPLEKVFPASHRARDVRDALARWAAASGVRVQLEAAVGRIAFEDGLWRVLTREGGAFAAPRLVLAVGGQSYPRTGTTGDGYAWLAALGLPLVAPVPALVPLTSGAAWVHAMTGISLQAVEARLEEGSGRVLERRARPVVFTHRGLSGPGAMDLSAAVARRMLEQGAEVALRVLLDLLPAATREELRARLIEAAGEPRAPAAARALSALADPPLPKRLLQAVFAQAAVPFEARANAVTRAQRHALVEGLKGLVVPVDGTLGYEQAEVTAGGLALAAVDPGSMQVRGFPGLFVVGELLDLQGPIGGLNFQAAFSTAELCALGLG